MGIKERLKRKITMTVLERQCTVIVSLLGTLLLFRIWPRFRADALSLDWKVYVLLIFIFAIPFFKRSNKETK
jgi:hypothetical protein